MAIGKKSLRAIAQLTFSSLRIKNLSKSLKMFRAYGPMIKQSWPNVVVPTLASSSSLVKILMRLSILSMITWPSSSKVI